MLIIKFVYSALIIGLFYMLNVAWIERIQDGNNPYLFWISELSHREQLGGTAALCIALCYLLTCTDTQRWSLRK